MLLSMEFEYANSLDGIETTQILKKGISPKVKVLIFSMLDREGYISKCI